MRNILTVAAISTAITIPAAAQAQSAPVSGPFVGLSGGYHSLEVDTDGVVAPGVDLPDSGAIYGLVAGYDVPVSENVSIGVEGNMHLGSSVIDYEYGAAARLVFATGSNSNIFLRAGVQWVDIDVERVIGGPLPAGVTVDDEDQGYMLGAGAEFGLGQSGARLRLGVDTVTFDTVRATAGLVFRF